MSSAFNSRQSTVAGSKEDQSKPQNGGRSFEYLSKMFQPPKGTKFSTGRTALELNKHATTSKQEAEKSSATSFLTPTLKEELERMESKVNFDTSFKLSDLVQLNKSASVLDYYDSREDNVSASTSSRHSKTDRHKGSKSSRDSRRSRSKDRKSDGRSSERGHGSRRRSSERSRSGPLRRSRSRSKDKRGSKQGRKDKGGRNEGKNKRQPQQQHQDWPDNSSHPKGWRNVGNKGTGVRLAAIEKLKKLNMLERFVETRKIYETVIEPAEQAKIKEREDKLNSGCLSVKTADEATIAQTLESNMMVARNLTAVTSEKRLISLMCTMRFYLCQLNVDPGAFQGYFEKYLSQFSQSMGWEVISPESAIVLGMNEDSDPLKKFRTKPDEAYSCKQCSLVYPATKFPCITCSQLFTCLPDCFAHEFTCHNRLVQLAFVCFICQRNFGADPISFSAHYNLEHVCQKGHSECAFGCKTLILGSSCLDLENHMDSQHYCKLCGDLLGDCLDAHLSFFHPSVKPSEYLPAVANPPLILDTELAKLNDLLMTIETTKQNPPPQLPPVEICPPPQQQNPVNCITELNSIGNVHTYLTTSVVKHVTSVDIRGNNNSVKRLDESPVSTYQQNSYSGTSTADYVDNSLTEINVERDPRMKSEFYKSNSFFTELGTVGRTVTNPDAIFGKVDNYQPIRSTRYVVNLKLLSYSGKNKRHLKEHDTTVYFKSSSEEHPRSNHDSNFGEKQQSPPSYQAAYERVRSQEEQKYDSIIHGFNLPSAKARVKENVPFFADDHEDERVVICSQVEVSPKKAKSDSTRDPRIRRLASEGDSDGEGFGVKDSKERLRMERTLALYLSKNP